jgi:hypothetical protein
VDLVVVAHGAFARLVLVLMLVRILIPTLLMSKKTASKMHFDSELQEWEEVEHRCAQSREPSPSPSPSRFVLRKTRRYHEETVASIPIAEVPN